MDKCPNHPQYFKTANTPCPACQFEESADGAATQKESSEWLRQTLSKMRVREYEQLKEIDRLKSKLDSLSIVALIGWVGIVVLVVDGLRWL